MVHGSQIPAGSSAEDEFDIVHAKILRLFPELVSDLGGDPEALLAQVGIPLHSFSLDLCRITYRQVVELLELAASRLSCPDFGMRLAVYQSGGRMFGPLGNMMRNSKTFGDALEYVSTHNYAHSLAASIWLMRSRFRKTVFGGHDILIDGLQDKRQAVEQILLIGHLTAMEITGAKARARRVHFRHQPISSRKTYRQYFGCEVLFDQNQDGLVFSLQDLACPVIEPNEQTYKATAAYIAAGFPHRTAPLRAQVRGVVTHFLGAGQCTNEQVAAELKLHPRTLHRRLAASGTSFQKIKNEVRRDLMLYYLRQTDIDFTSISQKLGYAEQSEMTRCCNRWLHASPTRVRLRARLAPPG